MTETYLQKMDRLTRDAEIIKEKYSKNSRVFFIAGIFTLEEMIEYRASYIERGELFIPYNVGDIFPDYDANITEFMACLLMSNLEFCKFVNDKYNQK